MVKPHYICEQNYNHEIHHAVYHEYMLIKLLIQQKLELQGKVDSLKAALEQEKESQQLMQEQMKKEEEKQKQIAVNEVKEEKKDQSAKVQMPHRARETRAAFNSHVSHFYYY